MIQTISSNRSFFRDNIVELAIIIISLIDVFLKVVPVLPFSVATILLLVVRSNKVENVFMCFLLYSSFLGSVMNYLGVSGIGGYANIAGAILFLFYRATRKIEVFEYKKGLTWLLALFCLFICSAITTNRGNMPLVYHSIVRRDVLDKVSEKTGSFFPGNSPDMSNAVALSLVVEKYAIIDYPLAFSGWSMYHGGGVHATGNKGHPAINEVPWFRPDAEVKWDKKVPRIAAGTLIWADSAISALKNMGMDNLYQEINFSKMYARFALGNPGYRNCVDEVCINKVAFKRELVKTYLDKYINALFRRIGWKTGLIKKRSVINNVDNILDAVIILNKLGKEITSPF